MRRFWMVLSLAFAATVVTAQAASAAEPVATIDDIAVAEDAGPAVVRVQLDKPAPRRTTVTWETANGTARAGADYAAKTGTVVFEEGDRSRSISITLNDDSLDEGAERFRILLASSRASLPDDVVAVTITDDDPMPSVRAGSVTVTEGARGTTTDADVTVKLSKVSGRDVRVDWRVVNGSATAGADATGAGTARIPAGATQVSVLAEVVGDDVAEGDEVAVVSLRDPTNARLGQAGSLAIDDDDDPATSTDLQLKLAHGKAVSKRFDNLDGDGVTLLGGTVTTTSANGTVYSLKVAKGALFKPVTITMTPWLDVEGVSVSGGRLAGVDLKPSGTEFLKPARLTITPPDGNPVEVESFSYEGAGREAHRYPVALDHTGVAFDLMHFTGVGGYMGDNISIPVEPAPPSDPAQAIAAEIQRIIAEERARALRNEEGDPEWADKIKALMQSYYDNVVLPLLSGIRTDCTSAKRDNAKVLGWARNAALLFSDTAFVDEAANVLDAVADGSENCLEEAMKPCVDQEDAAQMAEIIRAWRHVKLFGRPDPDPSPFAESRKCKDMLVGTVTVTYDKVLDVNGFRTEEQYTLTLQPRLLPDGFGGWYDDGSGGWTLAGGLTLEDHRAQGGSCGTEHEHVYSGDGPFYAGSHPDPLDDSDQGNGKIGLYPFLPQYDFNYGVPTLTGEVVGDSSDTFHDTDGSGGCTDRTSESTHWVQLPSCLPGSPGVKGTITDDDQKGRGVAFNCTITKSKGENYHPTADEASEHWTVVGTLWPMKP